MRLLPSPADRSMSARTHIGKIALVFAALLVAVTASPAAATSYHDAIRDCFDDGQLEGHYSRHQLQQALTHLPADQAEYSDCRDVLRRAMVASGGRGGGGGSPSAIPSNPGLSTPSGAQAGSQQDYNALRSQTDHSGNAKPPKVDLSGSPVTPAEAHFDSNNLPGSLLAALIALAAASAIAAMLVIVRRWPQTRRVAQRLLRR